MPALKAILITAGIVFAALGSALVVLFIVWLIGSYSVDRLIALASLFLTAAAILFTVIIELRRRR